MPSAWTTPRAAPPTTLPTIAKNLDKGETGVDGVPSIAVDPHDPNALQEVERCLEWQRNWQRDGSGSAGDQREPVALERRCIRW